MGGVGIKFAPMHPSPSPLTMFNLQLRLILEAYGSLGPIDKQFSNSPTISILIEKNIDTKETAGKNSSEKW